MKSLDTNLLQLSLKQRNQNEEIYDPNVEGIE